MLTDRQRALRRNHLGASDAPAIICDENCKPLSPFRTPADVYCEKVYELDDATTEPMRTGHRLEGPLIQFAAEELGVEATRANRFRVVRDNHGICACTVDAWVVGKPQAIEAKYVGPLFVRDWGEPGTDQVPDYVLAQVLHQMYVAELDRVWVAAAIADFELRWCLYDVPRNDELIGLMVEQELAFWIQHVAPGIPPDDYRPSLQLVRRIRRIPDKTVAVEQQLVNTWQDASRDRLAAKKAEDSAKAAVLAAMGDADGATCDAGLVTYYASERKGYTVPSGTVRRLRYKKRKD